MTNLNRRALLKSGLAASTVLAAPAILRAQSAVELTVVHGSPNSHVISAGGVEPWMEKLTELVGDAVSFRYYPAGQLAELRALLPAVQSGVADAVPIPIGYASDKMPLNGVSMLPGIGSSARSIIEAYAAEIEEGPLAREFEQNEVVPIWNMAYAPYQYVATDGPILTAEGFGGKVIRSAGGSMNLAIQALGGSPTEMPAGDIYVAMERGTVTATLSSFNTIEAYGVSELCDAASTNGSFGSFTNVFSISERKWETIPADIQSAMMEAGAWTEGHVAGVLDGSEQELAESFAADGMELFEFPEDELTEINDRLAAVHEDWSERLAERGLAAKEVLSSYRGRFAA